MSLQRKRGVRFKASELEAGRTYMWRKEFLPVLYRYLELRKGQTIVDVGCGTGAFSRLVLNGIRYQGKVFGIDKNRRLLSVAKRITREKNFPKDKITFRFGRAESLPFEDNFADRVVCQMVLWAMTEKIRRRTVEEMVRVCKHGGLVFAVDCVVEKVSHYYPDDERLTYLANKYNSAIVVGMKKRYGYDKNIGYKLPKLFREAGLKRVRLDGYAYVWFESDDRIPLDFRLKNHKSYLVWTRRNPEIRKEDMRIAIAGGMASKDIEEMRGLYLKRSKEIVNNPELLNEDGSMNSGIFYIVTGIKVIS